MMNILVASDSFKGCLSSPQINDAIERGIRQVVPDSHVIKIPIADGGEGTCEALLYTLGGQRVTLTVHDPLMRPITAYYGILPNGTAIIEMAQAAGLTLLSEEERNPLYTTTYGVGEMVKDAMVRGCRDFIIAIGGSCTNDAGLGFFTALGYTFYDNAGNVLPGIGASLEKIATMDDAKVIPELANCRFQVMCDVTNPFYGPNGASFVYAPQKGADPKTVIRLDHGLRHVHRLIQEAFGIDLQTIPGSGAAGGFGGGLYAFLNAQLIPGIELLLELVNIDSLLKDVDLMFTGEGKIDHQSAMGKVLTGLGKRGSRYQIPVIALCGTVSDGYDDLFSMGITSVFSVLDEPLTAEQALHPEMTLKRIERTSANIMRAICACRQSAP